MSFITTVADAFTVVLTPEPRETAEERDAAIAQEREDAAAAGPITVQKITLRGIFQSLVEGFSDLRQFRTHNLTIAAMYPLCGLIVAAVVANRALVPFLFPAVAGFALIGPLATLWYAALSRQREITGDATAEDALNVLRGPRAPTLRILSAVAILLFLLWNGAAALIYWQTLGTSSAEPDAFFLTRVLTTQAGWEMIVIGVGVGAVFAVIAVAIGCVSFPLALDRSVTASEAIGTSLKVMAANPVLMLIWGAIIVAGLILGAIPGLLGLAVTLPVLGHATWHVYRRVIA